ncbi:MAG: biopolymer transporter ExbD [Alteraurantiacibacter sp.]
MAEINVTPFVDVMLVLLIIFMVTAPLLTSGVPLDLPDSRANALDQDPNEITVAVDETGAVFIDDSPVAQGNLGEALERAASANGGGEQPVVVLRADRTLEYGRIMAVMGEINRAGFGKISMVSNGSSQEP